MTVGEFLAERYSSHWGGVITDATRGDVPVSNGEYFWGGLAMTVRLYAALYNVALVQRPR